MTVRRRAYVRACVAGWIIQQECVPASQPGAASIARPNADPFFPTVPTFAVRETASLGIMGAPRVPPLDPSETIVLSEHYRLYRTVGKNGLK